MRRRKDLATLLHDKSVTTLKQPATVPLTSQPSYSHQIGSTYKL